MRNKNFICVKDRVPDVLYREKRLRMALIRIIVSSVLFLMLFLLAALEWEPYLQAHELIERRKQTNASSEALEAAAAEILSGN